MRDSAGLCDVWRNFRISAESRSRRLCGSGASVAASLALAGRLVHSGPAFDPMFLHALKTALIAIATLPACLSLCSDTAPLPVSRMDRLPRVTLWAWERAEDISSGRFDDPPQPEQSARPSSLSAPSPQDPRSPAT